MHPKITELQRLIQDAKNLVQQLSELQSKKYEILEEITANKLLLNEQEVEYFEIEALIQAIQVKLNQIDFDIDKLNQKE